MRAFVSVLALGLAVCVGGATPSFAQSPTAASTSRRAPVSYAIVIGANDGGPARQRLSYADDDAARMFQTLSPVVRRGFLLTTFDAVSAKAHTELTFVAEPASLKSLARVVGELKWEMKRHQEQGTPTELWVYFAGHGDVDDGGEGYLALADERLSRRQLQEWVVDEVGADVQHVVIDACASYFMASRGGKELPSTRLTPKMFDAVEAHRSKPTQTGYLLSTSTDAQVQESDAMGGGVFSHLLRSALLGAGDVDGDGRVEYAEAAAFIDRGSAGYEDARLHLQVYARPPLQRPHAALSDLRRVRAGRFLRIPKGRLATVQVYDDGGSLYAQVTRQPDRGAWLSLQGSAHFVVVDGADEAHLHPDREGGYAMSSLTFRRSPRHRGAALGGGRHASLAVDEQFLQGFTSRGALLFPRRGDAFDVELVDGYEAPFRMPWLGISSGLFAGAGLSAAVALGGTGLNLWAFSRLQQQYDETGVVDGPLTLELEMYRSVASGAMVLTGVFALGGAATLGMWWLEEGAE